MARILTGQKSQILRAHAGSVGWWDGGDGSIPVANVKEHVENPTQGQLYAGGALSSAWSVSFRCTLASVPTNQYAFDSATGRVVIGITATDNGFYAGSWNNCTLFAIGDHTYMLVSTGSSVQAYRDGSAVGSATSSANDIGGTTRWRSNNDGLSMGFAAALRAGHVANIALSAAQRAALHTAMMALA